jgi:hypothetical protein
MALQLFERVVWQDSDLDIYVKREDEKDIQSILALREHFVKFEGYTVDTTFDPEDYSEKRKSITQVGQTQKCGGRYLSLTPQRLIPW